MIPLILRLKKNSHREIAKAQDLVVETLYNIFNNAVFHGGTSIWRCYKGNRFSEDIDVYLTRDLKKINEFFSLLEKKGFIVEKKKITETSIFSTLKFNRENVRFEAVFKKISGSLKEYETAEGNFLIVYALKPEELIKEKINAYLKRQKIRDLYDIFFLLRYVENLSSVKKELKGFIVKFENPKDENNLKVLVLEGLIPSKEKMLEYIKNKL
ncbi:nucleotidyl transferase AbiEii/AbiGii toxin family protein [Candidatus Woesearchaeota archaeon]|nr:nucleotidyl transferase AbiEii/AbiGii toxin family protein [Candidatus Woesearchaeota archaeon]